MKYPGINRTFNSQNIHKDSHSKRGMSLEKDINTSNKYYLNNNIAIIYKKPTPIKLVKVSYPKRSKAKITEAACLLQHRGYQRMGSPQWLEQ